jgi:D-glycero-D-manno-heptose 1,7-bisphosphate phosphatase
MNKSKKLIILDRDGVINLDSDNYIKNMDEWIAIPSSLKAISMLNRAGYNVAVATNQSGLARGYFNAATLSMMHKKMEHQLAEVGGHIDALEFCPDHPNQPGPDRKPNPGMANRLLKLFNAVPQETWFVGDSKSDIDCALNAKCKPVLVLTGKGGKTLKTGIDKNVPVFSDLEAFVTQLLDAD